MSDYRPKGPMWITFLVILGISIAIGSMFSGFIRAVIIIVGIIIGSVVSGNVDKETKRKFEIEHPVNEDIENELNNFGKMLSVKEREEYHQFRTVFTRFILMDKETRKHIAETMDNSSNSNILTKWLRRVYKKDTIIWSDIVENIDIDEEDEDYK